MTQDVAEAPVPKAATPAPAEAVLHLDEALRVRRVWIAGKLYDYR